MYEIIYHDCREDSARSGSDAELVRKAPLPSSGVGFEGCGRAFLPGCRLRGAEPEIAAKAYGSILATEPGSGILMKYCGSADIADDWKELGEPVIITDCIECRDNLRKAIPENHVTTIYEYFQDMKVSGGCNSVDYRIYDPEGCRGESCAAVRAAVAELAESMGVTLHDQDEEGIPWITYCFDCRDSIKEQGDDAVHILELLYGMGDSNTHMIHEEDHGGAPQDESDGLSPHPPAPLPDDSRRDSNRKELKEVLLQLLW